MTYMQATAFPRVRQLLGTHGMLSSQEFSLTMADLYTRGMSRDEDQYPDPEIFMPGRFLKPNQPTDPREYIFGFGRR